MLEDMEESRSFRKRMKSTGEMTEPWIDLWEDRTEATLLISDWMEEMEQWLNEVSKNRNYS